VAKVLTKQPSPMTEACAPMWPTLLRSPIVERLNIE
jgi:hypothetical protein